MSAQLAVQQILRKKMIELKGVNPRISLRGFAARAGISAGAMSAILNGKRAVSLKSFEKICFKLSIDPQDRAEAFRNFHAFPRSSGDGPEFVLLSAAQFRLIAEWENFAILPLLEVPDFHSDPQWMAGRLGISQQRIQRSLEGLQLLGLISQNKKGDITRTSVRFRSSDDVQNSSIQRFHDQSLDLARESLIRDPIEDRDFCATTFAFDPESLPRAKALIRQFHDDLSALAKEKKGREVFRLSSQLFPLTKNTNKKSKGTVK